MTRNNLDKHLQWLLSAGQSASTVSVPNYHALDVARVEAVQCSPDSTDIALDNASQDFEGLTIDHATTTQTLQPPSREAHNGPRPSELPTNMARLQCEPRSSGKTQMLSRESPANLQLPSPAFNTSRGHSRDHSRLHQDNAVTKSPRKGSTLILPNCNANVNIRSK